MILTPQVRDKLDMKLHNRTTVWDLIFTLRPVSRAQLAKITDMSPTSITRIVGELMRFGLLVEKPATHRELGRKAAMLDVDRDALYTVGIDIDVDSLQTCLLDLDNKPRSFLARSLRGRRVSPERMIDTAHKMYLEMLSTASIPEEKVKAVGVSIGGIVDREKGNVVVSRQLHWRNVALREIAEAAFGLSASIENDVKAAVYEEYIRHPECRAATVAYLTIGSGVGSALMCDGKILRGVNNAAGIISHVAARPGGERCDCGMRGCFYACLSEKALLERIRRRSKPSADMDRWMEARRRGEAWATELGEEVAKEIATALNHILCGYDPEVVIVGGKLFYAQPDLLDLALAQKGLIYEALRPGVRILRSLSNARDSVIGAAILAKSDHLEKLLNERLQPRGGDAKPARRHARTA